MSHGGGLCPEAWLYQALRTWRSMHLRRVASAARRGTRTATQSSAWRGRWHVRGGGSRRQPAAATTVLQESESSRGHWATRAASQDAYARTPELDPITLHARPPSDLQYRCCARGRPQHARRGRSTYQYRVDQVSVWATNQVPIAWAGVEALAEGAPRGGRVGGGRGQSAGRASRSKGEGGRAGEQVVEVSDD